MQNVLKRFQDRLADSSRRNPAVYLKRLVRCIDYTDSELGVTPFTDKNAHKQLLTFIRYCDSRHKERGFSEQYVAEQFLEGFFADGSPFRAPLILTPVTFVVDRVAKKIKPNFSASIVNRSFLLALSKYHKLDISFAELETISVEDIFTFLEKNGITFIRKSAKGFVEGEVSKNLVESGWVLYNYKILGEFPQIQNSINQDYDTLIAQNISNELFSHVTGNITAHKLSYVEDPSEVNQYFITRPDVSQEQALLHARRERGIVIHGPPGTGKSQVITNTIADHLALGKTVLVVCEKRAALDVVYNRLQRLQDFAVLAHSPNRAQVYESMRQRIEKRNSLVTQTVQREDLLALSHEFDTTLRRVKSYVHTTQQKLACGHSPFFLYTHAQKEQVHTQIPFAHKFTQSQLTAFLAKVSQFETDSQRIFSDTYIWFNRKSFAKVDFALLTQQLQQLLRTCQKVSEFQPSLVKQDLVLFTPSPFMLKTMGWQLSHFNKFKDSIFRFIDPFWLFTAVRAKRVIREQQLGLLTKRWEVLSPEFKKVHLLLRGLPVNKQWREAFWNALYTYKSVNYVQGAIEALDDFTILQKLDSLSLSRFERKLFTILRNLPVLIGLDEQSTARTGKSKAVQSHKSSKVATQSSVAELSGVSWKSYLENSLYVSWLSVYEKSQGKSYAHSHYLTDVELLNTLLTKKHSQCADFLYQKLYDKLDSATQLLHEISKKRNIPTLRELIQQNEQSVFSQFPVWMCSPQTVSDIFPLKPDLFDVVIFDEASQTKLEQALPSIVRAKKMIVSGDDKQLPPTSFFETISDEEYELEVKALLEDESLLVRSKTVFPSVVLQHHYRSKQEPLIAFSNHAFYHGDLLVLPTNSITQKPITYLNVKGKWEDSVNSVEAKRVVSLIKERIGEKTIGVITFNSKQRDLILDLLDAEARKDSQFAKKLDAEFARNDEGEFVGLFVKNIENVQGDEREVIIFSIAYAKGVGGKLRYNFGPLNGMYGPNRLNVAISRAKEEIVLVTSLEPSEFTYKGEFAGPKLLERYLTYCHAISSGDTQRAQSILYALHDSAGGTARSSQAATQQLAADSFTVQFRTSLAAHITQHATAEQKGQNGLRVVESVGSEGYAFSAGLINSRSTKFAVVVETEDILMPITSIKEREVYRPSILKAYGWNVNRVYASEWYAHRNRILRQITNQKA